MVIESLASVAFPAFLACKALQSQYPGTTYDQNLLYPRRMPPISQVYHNRINILAPSYHEAPCDKGSYCEFQRDIRDGNRSMRDFIEMHEEFSERHRYDWQGEYQDHLNRSRQYQQKNEIRIRREAGVRSTDSF